MSGVFLVLLGSSVDGGEESFFYIGSNVASGSAYHNFATAADADGNFYIAGNGLNGGTTSSVVLIKADYTGAIQWRRNLTNSIYGTSLYPTSISIDPADSAVYVCWPVPSTVSSHMMNAVSKYSADGTYQWTRAFTTSSISGGVGSVYSRLQFDASNVYIGANLSAGNTYAGTVTLSKSTGAIVSGRTLGYWHPYGGQNSSFGVALTSTGVVSAVAGQVASPYAGAGVHIISHNFSTNTVSYLRSFSPDGSTSYNIYPSSIATDSAGNIYVGGWYAYSNKYVAYVAKLNSSGTVLWAKHMNTSNAYSASSPINTNGGAKVVVDESGNVYAQVRFGVADIGVSPDHTAKGQNLLVTKFSSAGAVVFARVVTTDYDFEVYNDELSVVGSNALAIGFGYGAGVQRDPATAAPYGQKAFVLVVPTDGTKTGSYSVNGTIVSYSDNSGGVTWANWSGYSSSTYSLSTVGVISGSIDGSITSATNTAIAGATTDVDLTPARSSNLFSVPGTYCWPAPVGVTSVSAVVVGGGGGSGYNVGGGGGALAYKNNISVTPGTFYPVVVGKGGDNNSGAADTLGKPSSFISTSVVAVGPGINSNSPGIVLAGTGYQGGSGSKGGGGAGGYAGMGGSGSYFCGVGASGTGGAAGGGGGGNYYYCCCTGVEDYQTGASGGGVGVYGQGASGGGSITSFGGGFGGSGGGNGWSYAQGANGRGGSFGGGAGAYGYYCGCGFRTAGLGRNGAVRIVWPGNTRQFPSTDVAGDS